MDQPTEKTFLDDVKDHELQIIKDDDVDRHLRLRLNNSRTMGFDIITWPQHLLITGDMGSYLFRRTEDMFGFFRTSDEFKQKNPDRELFINTMYWQEKCISVDRRCKMRKWSPENFKKSIKEYFEYFKESCDDKKEIEKEQERLRHLILSRADNEIEAVNAVWEYPGKTNFDDFWESTVTEYSYQFLWCLYAIVWAIEQYDQQKTADDPVPA